MPSLESIMEDIRRETNTPEAGEQVANEWAIKWAEITKTAPSLTRQALTLIKVVCMSYPALLLADPNGEALFRLVNTAVLLGLEVGRLYGRSELMEELSPTAVN